MSSKLIPFSPRPAPGLEAEPLAVDEQSLLKEYRRLALSLDELFEEVFFAYNQYLAAYVQRRWDEVPVEDILQSAWIVLWNDIKRGDFFQRTGERTPAAQKPMLAFLIKTCENLVRNLWRHARHFPHVSLDEVGIEPVVEPVNKDLSQAEVRVNFHHIRHLAIAACTPDECRVLDLLALGLSRLEIAEMTGRKPHWVDNRRRAACRKIRAELERRRRMISL